MKKLFVVLAAIFLLAVVACSGGGGGSNHTSSWDSLTPGGYPDVKGTYSFTTEDITYTCSDGRTGTVNKVDYYMNVSQSESTVNANKLVPNGGSDLPAGITIIDATPLSGVIQKNGEFVLNQTVTAQIEGISGNVTYQYVYDGKFTPTGWSGDYSYTAFSPGEGYTCDNETIFYGDKVSASTKSASSEMPATEKKDNNDESVNEKDVCNIGNALLGY